MITVSITDVPDIAGQNINAAFRFQLRHYMHRAPAFLHRRSPRYYKQGASSRYNSADDASATAGLSLVTP